MIGTSHKKRKKHVFDPLPKLQIDSNTLEIINKNNNIISVDHTLLSTSTGSKSFVYQIECNDNNNKFHVVAKVQPNSRGKYLRATIHEKHMYKIMNFLHDFKICPFVLRSYDVPNKNIVLTESDINFVPLHKITTITNLDNTVCHHLLIQILYTIEVFQRIKLKHNDLHVNNILVRPIAKTDLLIQYHTRNDNNIFPFFMTKLNFLIAIFDHDRDMKMRVRHLKTNIIRQQSNHKAVTDRFSWYNPKLNTEKIDLFKIFHHLSSLSKTPGWERFASIFEKMCSNDVCPIKSPSNMKQLTKQKHLISYDLLKYHILLNKNMKKELVIPDFMPSSDEMLLELHKTYYAYQRNQKAQHVYDINRLYQ